MSFFYFYSDFLYFKSFTFSFYISFVLFYSTQIFFSILFVFLYPSDSSRTFFYRFYFANFHSIYIDSSFSFLFLFWGVNEVVFYLLYNSLLDFHLFTAPSFLNSQLAKRIFKLVIGSFYWTSVAFQAIATPTRRFIFWIYFLFSFCFSFVNYLTPFFSSGRETNQLSPIFPPTSFQHSQTLSYALNMNIYMHT